MEDERKTLQETIEDAVVNRLKDMFANEDQGKEIINKIRDKVLEQDIDLNEIKKNFEF